MPPASAPPIDGWLLLVAVHPSPAPMFSAYSRRPTPVRRQPLAGRGTINAIAVVGPPATPASASSRWWLVVVRCPAQPLPPARTVLHPPAAVVLVKQSERTGPRSSLDANPWYAELKNATCPLSAITSDIVSHCSGVGLHPVGLCAHAWRSITLPAGASDMSSARPSKSSRFEAKS